MTTTQANGSGGDGLKITMVGAGGMSFGPTMVNDVVRTAGLRGARLVLHDVNAERLDRALPLCRQAERRRGRTDRARSDNRSDRRP